MSTETDLAWMAGILDGEGCIFISRAEPQRRNGKVTVRHSLGVKVTMGHEPTIDRLHTLAGLGTKQIHKSCGPKINASWSWLITSRRAGEFLTAVRPYVFTKAEETDLAFEFLALPLAERGGRNGSPVTSLETLEERERLWRAMRDLKPRNRFRA